jgi:hypothetical protein
MATGGRASADAVGEDHAAGSARLRSAPIRETCQGAENPEAQELIRNAL